MYLLGYSLEQPVADGADHLDRLRRRRRHRDDREHRALHRGGRVAAARPRSRAREQIGFTIVSLTVSLIAVLIPLLFMGDIVGRLFREFAVTLSVTILVSAVVSLTLTPMMCAQAAAPHARRRSRAGSIARSERVFDRDRSRATARRCAGCCGTRRATLLVAVATLVAHGLPLRRRAEGLLPGAGHRRDPRHLRGAADGLVRRHGRAPAGAGRRDPAGSRRREPVVVHRRRRHQHDAQQRPHPDQPEAARRARRRAPATSSAACSRSSPRSHGITLFMQPVQDLTVEDRVSRTQYQYSLEDRRRRRAARVGAAAASRSCRRCPSCATWRATSRTAACRRTLVDRSRHRVAARHHAADDRRHALRRLRPAPGLDDLHAAEPVPRRPGGATRASSRARRRSKTSTSARRPAAQVPLSAFTHFEPTTHAAGGQPPGAVPGGDALVQPGARASSLGDAVDAIDAAEREIGLPAEHPRQLPGHGAGVPGLARQRAAADPGGARHRLHRARRALRELHPPDHDSLDAALGRRRRAPRAAALPAPTSA